MALQNKLNIVNQIDLTDKIDQRKIFMEGIDISYYYEGYSAFKTEDV